MSLLRRARKGAKLVLTVIALLAAVVVLFRFVGVILARLGYPFDLEWMESGVIAHVRRVAAGKPLYGPPSLEFTAFIYPPFYYYVSALFSSVLGLGHFAPRLVSVLSILGVFVLIGRWVARETNDWLAGFVAVAAFCSCYGVAEYWYDVARVDSLFLLLLLGGLTLLRVASSPRQAIAAGALLALSCLTKQSALPYALVALPVFALRDYKLALRAGLVFLGLLVVAVLVLNLGSHGYFWYYVVQMPSRHEVEWHRLVKDFKEYLWQPATPMVLAAGALLCGVGFRSDTRWPWAFNAAFVAVAGCMSMTSLLKTGGYVNALMPAYAAFAIALGIQVGTLRKASAFGLGSVGAHVLATGVFFLQLWLLDYDHAAKPPDMGRGTRTPVPTREDLEAGLRMNEMLKTLPEPLWVTGSSEYSRVDGEAGRLTHTMGVVDVMKGGGLRGEATHEEIARAIVEKKFRCIVLDRAIGFLTSDFLDLIQKHYQKVGSVMTGAPPNAFWPRSGAWLRPDEIWVPKR